MFKCKDEVWLLKVTVHGPAVRCSKGESLKNVDVSLSQCNVLSLETGTALLLSSSHFTVS